MQKRNLSRIAKMIAIASAIGVLASPALAADFRSTNGSDSKNLQVPASTNTRNLYAAGAQVTINASPVKDLVVAGGMVNVNGNVGDDLLLAGGNLNVKGTIGGSARIFGGNVYIDSPSIAEDLLVGAGTVYIHSSTIVKGDLIVGGGNVVLDGHVLGNVKIAGGSVVINGKVDGNIDGRISQTFELGAGAEVKGNINYSARLELRQDPAAKVLGQVNYSPLKKGTLGFGPVLTVVLLIRLLGIVIVAVLLFGLFKNRFTRLALSVGNKFWQNVGIGLAGIIIVPVVVALLFVTLVGYYAAFILIAAFILTLMLGSIIGAAYFGSWLVAKIDRKEIRIDYVAVILGVVLASVLRYVPLLGWIFAGILCFSGFGAMLKAFAQARKE